MIELERMPGAAASPTDYDQRWLKRFQTWRKSNEALHRLYQNDTEQLREQIVETALATGLFSIWWTVFAHDSDLRSRLRTAFVGTCPNSFDENGDLQGRPGGQL